MFISLPSHLIGNSPTTFSLQSCHVSAVPFVIQCKSHQTQSIIGQVCKSGEKSFMEPRRSGVTYHGEWKNPNKRFGILEMFQVILPRSAGSPPTLDVRSLSGPLLHQPRTWARGFIFSQHGSRSARPGPSITLKRKYRCCDIHSDRSSLLAPTSSQLATPKPRTRHVASTSHPFLSLALRYS